jgi:hypothetical protein
MSSDIVSTLWIRAINEASTIVKSAAGDVVAANAKIKASSDATTAAVLANDEKMKAGAAGVAAGTGGAAAGGAAAGGGGAAASSAGFAAAAGAASKYMMVVGAAGIVTGAVAVKMASDWEDFTQKIQGNTGITTKELDYIKQKTLELGQQGPAALNDVAGGYEKAANEGFHYGAATEVVTAGWKAAIATGGKVTDVVNALAVTMGDFHDPASKASTDISILMAAAAQGNIRLPQLTDNFSKVAALAANMHMPLADAASAYSALTRQTANAAVSQTEMVGILTHVLNPTKLVVTEMAKLKAATGVDLAQAFQQFAAGQISFTQLMEDARKATQGNTGDIMQLFGGIRGGFGAVELMGKGWQNYLDISKKVHDSNDMLNTEFTAMSKTVGFQMGIVKNDLNELGIAVGTALLPPLTALLGAIAPVAASMANWAKQNQGLATVILSLMIGIGLLGVGIKATIITMNLWKAAQDLATAATAEGGIVTLAVGAATKAYAVAAGLVAIAMGDMSIAVKAAAAAQFLLDTAMDANPIGLVIIAVAALVAGFILLYTHCTTVRDAVIDLAHWFGSLANLLGSVVHAAIQGIGDLFSWLGGKIQGAISDIEAFLGKASALTNFAHTIGSVFHAAGSAIGQFGNGIVDASHKTHQGHQTMIQSAQAMHNALALHYNQAGKSATGMTMTTEQMKTSAVAAYDAIAGEADKLGIKTLSLAQLHHLSAKQIEADVQALGEKIKSTLASVHAADAFKAIKDAATDATDSAIAANNKLEASTAASWKRMADTAIAQASRIKAVLPTFSANAAPGVAGPASAIGVQQQIDLGDKIGLAIRKQIEATKISASGSQSSVIASAPGGAATNAGMSSAMGGMQAVFGQLPGQFASAVAPVLQGFADKLKALRESEVQKVQTEDTRHETALAAINKTHEEAVKSAESSAASQRKALDASWISGQKNLQASQEAAVKAHQASLATTNATANQSLHTTLLSHEQSLKSMSDAHDSTLQNLHDAYLQKLDGIQGKNVEARRAAAKEAYDRSVSHADQSYARQKTAADGHLAATISAYKNHEQARSTADQQWLDSRKGVDAVQEAKLAGGYTTHADAINAALKKHLEGLNQHESDSLAKEDTAHAKHLHDLQQAFQDHAALIEKAMKTASTPQAIWESVTKGVADQTKNDTETLDLAILEHGKNLKALTSTVVADQVAQQQLTDAQTKGALDIALAGGDLSSALTLLATQITQTTNHIGGLIYSHTGGQPNAGPSQGQRTQNREMQDNGGKDIPGTTKMQAAIDTLVGEYEKQKQVQAAQTQAQFIAAKATGDWSSVIQIESGKYSKAVDEASSKILQDILKRGTASDADVASLVKAEQAEKTFTDAQAQAAIIVAKSSGDYTTLLSTQAKTLATNVSEATDKLTYDLANHTGNVTADTAAVVAATSAQNTYNATVAQATMVADQASGDFSGALKVVSDAIATKLSQAIDQTTLDVIQHGQVTSADIASVQASQAAQDSYTESVWEAKFATADLATQSQMLKDRFSSMVSDATSAQGASSGVDSANLALIAEESKAQVAAMTDMITAINDQTAVIQATSAVSQAVGNAQVQAIKDQGAIQVAQIGIQNAAIAAATTNASTANQNTIQLNTSVMGVTGIINVTAQAAAAKADSAMTIAQDQLTLAQDAYRADMQKAQWDVSIAQMQVQIAMTKMAVDQANAAAQRVVQMDTLQLDTDKIRLAEDQLKLTQDQTVILNTINTALTKVNQYEAMIAGDLAAVAADQSQITQDNTTLAQDTGTAAATAVSGQMAEAQQSQQLAMDQAAQQASDLQNQMQQAMDQNKLNADQANSQSSTTNDLLQQQLNDSQDQNNALLQAFAIMRRGAGGSFNWAGGQAFNGWLNNLNAESVANGGA